MKRGQPEVKKQEEGGEDAPKPRAISVTTTGRSPSLQSSQKPDVWQKVEEGGTTYYWNTVTNEVSWEAPTAPVSAVRRASMAAAAREVHCESLRIDLP